MAKWLFALGVATLGLGGCVSDDKFVGRPGLELVSDKDLPPPDRQDLILQQRAYLIGPFDRLAIDVYGVGELSRGIQTDASGRIAMPLIGVVDAAGKTPAELGILIQARLRKYVRNPQVTVNLTETVSQIITVGGEVRTPGLYPVVGRMTLMRAIARAEGTNEFANENYVVVFRKVNGRDMAALYDLRAIRQGIYPDPELFANDVVTVGDSPSRRIFRDVISAAPLLAAPLVAIIQ